MHSTLGLHEILTAIGLGLLTLIRVVILIALASAVWVPIGVWIGLRPWAAERVQPIAQFLAAFPANVLFPIAVVAIVQLALNPNIWLSPLMVLGTQWYILFNVIAGASAFPTDLREAATLYRLRSPQWWRKVILPGILPYYVTGALTATGGSWNASIVAEVASWGQIKLQAAGIGVLYRGSDRRRRLSPRRARDSGDVDLRDRDEPDPVAPALSDCRRALSAQLERS